MQMKNATFAKKALRHGEAMVTPVDALPEGIEQVYEGKEFVLAHSETGHNHIAFAGAGGTISVFKPVGADDGTLFLKVSKDSRIEHLKSFDKHETLNLFKGVYQVTIKKAYDYFAKRLERVRD